MVLASRSSPRRAIAWASATERKIFVRLLGVSGIGPGTAMAILNGLSVDEFRRAVAAVERRREEVAPSGVRVAIDVDPVQLL